MAMKSGSYHGNQHVVSPLLSLNLHLLPFPGPDARADLHFGALLQRQGDHGVTERDDAARHDVLEHQTGHGEELPSLRLGPLLRAHVGVVGVFYFMIDSQRERDRH